MNRTTKMNGYSDVSRITKMNGYRTPEMVATSIQRYGHYVGCSQLNSFLNKYWIYDAGNFKVGVEVTFLNGKAVATRNVPADNLVALVAVSNAHPVADKVDAVDIHTNCDGTVDIKFGDF